MRKFRGFFCFLSDLPIRNIGQLDNDRFFKEAFDQNVKTFGQKIRMLLRKSLLKHHFTLFLESSQRNGKQRTAIKMTASNIPKSEKEQRPVLITVIAVDKIFIHIAINAII